MENQSTGLVPVKPEPEVLNASTDDMLMQQVATEMAAAIDGVLNKHINGKNTTKKTALVLQVVCAQLAIKLGEVEHTLEPAVEDVKDLMGKVRQGNIDIGHMDRFAKALQQMLNGGIGIGTMVVAKLKPELRSEVHIEGDEEAQAPVVEKVINPVSSTAGAAGSGTKRSHKKKEA